MYLCIYLFIYLFIYLSIHLFIYLFIYSFICIFICIACMVRQYFPVWRASHVIQAAATRQQRQLAKLLTGLTWVASIAGHREGEKKTIATGQAESTVRTSAHQLTPRDENHSHMFLSNMVGWVLHCMHVESFWAMPCRVQPRPCAILCLSNGWGVDNRHQKGWLSQHCSVEEAGVLTCHTKVKDCQIWAHHVVRYEKIHMNELYMEVSQVGITKILDL